MVGIFTGAGFGFEHGSGSVLGGIGLLGGTAQGRGGENVAVNAATGNLLIQKQDEFLVGRGPDASVARTYNSLTTLGDDNDDRWRQSTDRRLYDWVPSTEFAAGTIKRISADGTETLYTFDERYAAYVSMNGSGAYDTIEYRGTSWVWIDGDTGTVETYANDGIGKILSVIDTSGAAMTFTYDGSNRLTQIDTDDGSWIAYSWGSGAASGNITEIVTGYTDLTSASQTLTRTRYGYDGSNRLHTVTVDLSPKDNSILDDEAYVTTYEYNGAGRVESIGQSDGSLLEITYDGSQRVSTLEQTVASGVTRTTAIAYHSGYAVVTDEAGNVTQLNYDGDGNLTQITAPPASSGADVQVISFTYNTDGDVTSTTDALGGVTTYTDFTNGLAGTIIDRTGRYTYRTIDYTRNLVIEQFSDGESILGWGPDCRYVYDDARNLRFAITGEGRVTEYRRNGYGAVTTELSYTDAVYDDFSSVPTEGDLTDWVDGLGEDPRVNRIDYEYDARLNLLTKTSYAIAEDAGLELPTESVGQVHYVYDQAGQLLSSNATGQGATTYVYDGMGRLVSTSNPQGNTTTIVFNDAATKTTITTTLGRTTINTYNLAGELIQTYDGGTNVSGGGSLSYFTRDNLGRIRTTYNTNGDTLYNIYDDIGRMTAVIDDAGHITEYRYDADDRLVGTIHYRETIASLDLTELADPDNTLTIADIRPSVHAEDTSSWTVYDGEGRVIQTIAGDGSTVISIYDPSGRLMQTTAYSEKIDALTVAGFIDEAPSEIITPTSGDDQSIRYYHDGDGLLIGTMDGDGYVVENTYDQSGQLVASTAYANPSYVRVIWPGAMYLYLSDALAELEPNPALDRTTHFVYDGRGDLRFTVDALNHVSRYDYDAAGLKVRTVVFADELGGTADYSFDEILLATEASASGNRITYAVYDNAGRLAYSLDQQGAADSYEMAVTRFVYDADGNVTRTVAYAALRETFELPSLATMDTWAAGEASDTDNRITRMWYTARGELVFTVDAEGYAAQNYYDIKGRRVAEQFWDTAIAVTDSTTFAQVEMALTGTHRERVFSYDALGRVIREWDMAGESYTDYTYHGTTGLVTSMIRAAGGNAQEQATSEMIYDGAGRVIETIDAVGSDEEVSSTRSYNGRGLITSATDPRATSSVNPVLQTTSYEYDLNGRMISMTNAAGDFERYTYDAFGDLTTSFDARNNATIYYYDNLGRQIIREDNYAYEITTSYTIFGEVESVRHWVDPTGGWDDNGLPILWGDFTEITFTYDKAGRGLTSVDALSQTESYAYNAFGDRISTTNRLDLETTYTYDRLGRLTAESHDAETRNDDGLGGFTSGTQIVKAYEYYATGLVKELVEGFTTEPGGEVTALRTTGYAYDGNGRVTAITYDKVTVLEDDLLTVTEDVVPTETFTYDLRGNLIEAVDKAGAHTFSYYDDLDRKIAEVRQLASDEGVYTRTEYDEDGNIAGTRVYETLVSLPESAGGTPPTAPSGLYRETAFTYDGAGRMLTSEVVNSSGNAIITGSWNAGTEAYDFTDEGNLITRYEYDANGNIVKVIDPNQSETWSWYDALNQKIAQVDGEGYLTEWTYDAEGNVLSETRYAVRPDGPLDPEWSPTATIDPYNDRTTLYTYDANGNRLTEKRLGIVAWEVDAASGELTESVLDYSLIRYTYNALGQVVTKEIGIEDDADPSFTFKYNYGDDGRLLSEERAAFADLNDIEVTPTTEYTYDALGDLVGSNQAGSSLGFGVADRTTTYRYGEGGRLLSTTDAAGNVHAYSYDTAGRLKMDAYARLVNGDTSSTTDDLDVVNDAQTSAYDIAGRVIRKSVYKVFSSSLELVDFASFQYNVFDQVTAQGSNADGLGADLLQVTNQYDAAGRLVSTNAGDGVWRFFAYDGAGNQTAAISSAGAVFTSSTGFEGALALASGNDGNESYTVYDLRNQAIETIAVGMDLADSVTQTVESYRAYNAFGEVAYEAQGDFDPAIYTYKTTTYTYNTMGRLIRVESPRVMIKDQTGAENWIRPAKDFYYDTGGRLIATRDANGTYAEGTDEAPTSKDADTGKLTTYALLAGTGYDGSQSLTVTEFHSDGGKKQVLYDVMGDARVLRNELFDYDNAWSATQFFDENFYNALGQLTTVKHMRQVAGAGDSNRLIDNYVYDQFGQRIQHWNSQYGDEVLDKTDFDALGRVISQTDMEGHVTTTEYSWDGDLVTEGMTSFGGWEQATSYSDSTLVSTSITDLYGREVYKSDLGGNVSESEYDAAGRIVSRTTGADTLTWEWYNTGWLKTTVSLSGTESYSYDAAGNRLSETLVVDSETVKAATAQYDALGRMTNWAQESAYTSAYFTPSAQTEFYYDAVGNIRQTITARASFNTEDTELDVEEFWFDYDAMNRLIVDKGTLSGGSETTVVRGNAAVGTLSYGQNIEYNVAGQRTSVIRTNYTPGAAYYIAGEWQEVREIYDYFGDGALRTISVSSGDPAYDVLDPLTFEWSAPETIPTAPTSGTLRSEFLYDLMGRQLWQNDYEADGTTIAHGHTADYNAIGQVTYDYDITVKTDGKLYVDSNTYSYVSGSEYLLGSVAQVTGTNGVSVPGSGTTTKSTQTTYDYVWFDGAQQSRIDRVADTSHPTKIGRSDFTYDAFGQLLSVDVDVDVSAGSNARDRTITFVLDGSGQIIRRDEADHDYSSGHGMDPHELWYRFNGREMGYRGNNGTNALNADASIADRQQPTENYAMRNGLDSAPDYMDFTGSYDPINSYNQGSASGSYVVQQTGQSLSGIALQLWGDAGLWYKLAEANGLQADTGLVEGRRLNVPAGVARSTYNAATLRPYDAEAAIGNVSPTSPKPKKANKCGVFGQILLAAVAIAVVALAPTSIPAINAALGSIASQTVGIATGIQQKFSFKSVALAAIGADVGASLVGIGGSGVVGAAVRGAAGSAITQGIGVATGLQNKFNWAGVAAAGIGAAVGGEVAGQLKLKSLSEVGGRSIGNIAGWALANTAGALAIAATRTALGGGSFGDNLMRALPDAIGNTIGSLAADVISGGNLQRRINSIRNNSALDSEEKQGRIANLLIRQSAAMVAKTLGGKEAESYLKMVNDNRDLKQVFDLTARGYILGFDSLDGASLVDAQTSYGSEVITFDPDMLSVSGDRKFGDAAANALVSAAKVYTDLDATKQTAISIGFSVITAGPVGTVAGYAFDKVIEQGIHIAGLEQDISDAVVGFGARALSIFSSSDREYEGDIAASRPDEASNLVVAGAAILNLKSIKNIGKSLLSVSRAAESGVWKLNPFQRGQQIEQALGHNLPNNFPVIDRFENGLATSIKSLDLDAATYQSASTLNRTLSGYVDKVAGFQGRTWAGVRIRSQDITARSLDLAIPHGGSAAQQAIINQTVKYGASRGVTVNVIPFP